MNANILIVEDEFIIANDLRHILIRSGYGVAGIAASLEEAYTMVATKQPDWVLVDIYLQDGYHGTELARYLNERNIGFMYISANTDAGTMEAVKSTHPYGFLVKPFREQDLLIMLDIGSQKHRYMLEQLASRALAWKRELGLLRQLLTDAANPVERFAGSLQAFIPFDHCCITHIRLGKAGKTIDILRTGFDEYQVSDGASLRGDVPRLPGRPLKADIAGLFILPDGYLNGTRFATEMVKAPAGQTLSARYGFASALSHTLHINQVESYHIVLFSKKDYQYTAAQWQLLQLQEQLLGQLASRLVLTAGKMRRPGKSRETAALPAEVQRAATAIPGFVGTGPAMHKLFDNIEMVADSSTYVLIQGESGTGKELVAQRIHALSTRRHRPMVVVNCGALPADLIESELFGHERGSFTGATEKRIGKFELAHGGTLFLDEIGELPMDAQVKFLRVLQEMEIERVGGGMPVKVDVRVIAATNRNLEEAVAQGRFRLDLYYRLNVFPIDLPALREHKEDIPALVQHFIQKFAAKLQRAITGIEPAAMQELMQYHWPGNVRELEHVIERACVSTRAGLLSNLALPRTMAAVQTTPPAEQPAAVVPTLKLDEMEAGYILEVLRSCQGRVSGPGGAAEKLGLPASTLQSKMKKLGIRRS